MEFEMGCIKCSHILKCTDKDIKKSNTVCTWYYIVCPHCGAKLEVHK